MRLRYKAPGGDKSKLIEQPVERRDILTASEASGEWLFAASVAAFGQLLKGGDYVGDYGLEQVAELASGARGVDPNGYRGEFLSLVRLADSLTAQRSAHGLLDEGLSDVGLSDDRSNDRLGRQAMR